MTGRFTQLTYTSYDNGGRGGWQVKDVVGALSPAERETLVNRVVTTFDLEPKLPEFPSTADLAARPARLARERLPDGTVAMWHTVEAGRDGSGRPGNVFAHVLLDRGTPTAGEHRPISLWESAGWLRPYGPDQVVATSLASSVPPPNPAVDTSSAIAFVIASMERQAMFRVLMDAVLARLDGGPAVVLRVDDHEQAVAWISAVSHFLPRSAAHRLSWSTHDRYDRAVLDVANGFDMVAVPTGEVLDAGVSDAVILSPHDSAGLALPGGRHTLASGSSVAATTVSSLLEGALFDPSIAAEVLRCQDDVDERFSAESPSASWTFGVGFSIALAEMDDPDMAEFAREAERLLVSGFPPSAMDDPHTGPLIAEALIRNPMSAQACLGLLQRAQVADRPTADLAATYLTRAFEDGSWRATPLSSVPTVHSADLDAVRPQLEAVIGELGAHLASDAGSATPSVLILAETVRRLVTEPSRDALLAMFSAVRPSLSLAVFSGGRWPQNVQLTEIATSVYAQLIRPLLAVSEPSFVRKVPVNYWALFEVPVPGPNRPLLPPNPTEEDCAVLPYAALQFLQKPDLVGPDQVRVDVARQAVEATLSAGRYIPDDEARALTRDLLAVVPAVSVEIPRWVAQAPSRISGDALHRAVFHDRADLGLLHTLTDPTQAAGLGAIASAAKMRIFIADPYAPLPPRQEFFRLLRDTTTVVPTSGAMALEVADFLYAAVIVARSYDRSWASVDAPASQLLYQLGIGRDDAVSRQIARLVQGGVIEPDWTAGVAYLGDTAARQNNLPVDSDTTVALKAMHMLRATYPGPLSLDELRDACWRRLRYGSAAEAERFFETYRKSGAAWLRTNIPDADVQQRRLNPF